MKKLSQTVAVFALIAAPFAFSGNAAAASTCEVGYTGPDSDNMCKITVEYTCEVDTENNVTFRNDNGQIAGTGTASADGNTGTGTLSTGDASNQNTTDIDFAIDNSGAQTICSYVKTVPATVTPGKEKEEENDDKPGMGAIDIPSAPVAPVAAPQVAAPTVLPNTSADATLGYLVAGISLLAATAMGSRFAVSAYSRLKS